jgi:hypothetical protein
VCALMAYIQWLHPDMPAYLRLCVLMLRVRLLLAAGNHCMHPAPVIESHSACSSSKCLLVLCCCLSLGRWQGPQKAAIVASSAAGWISRIFLAEGPPYSNTIYYGADRVHTLVTLGTPHTSAEAVTRRNIDYVNNSYPGAHMPGVR